MCNCVITTSGNVVDFSTHYISDDHEPIVAILSNDKYKYADGTIVLASDLNWTFLYEREINTILLRCVQKSDRTNQYSENKIIKYLELNKQYNFGLPECFKSVVSFDISDKSNRFIRLNLKNGEHYDVCAHDDNYPIEYIFGYKPDSETVEFEFIKTHEIHHIDHGVIKVGDDYLCGEVMMQHPQNFNVYKSGELFVVHENRSVGYSRMTKTNSRVENLIGRKIYAINEIGVPYCVLDGKIWVLPISGVVKLYQNGRQVTATKADGGVTVFDIDYCVNIKGCGMFNVCKGATEFQEYIIHNGNALHICEHSIYNFGDYYYDLTMSRIYPAFRVDLPNCVLKQYKSIDVYNSDTFVFDGVKTILSPDVMRIKNIEFSGRLVYDLRVEFTDGRIMCACVIDPPNECLLFENGDRIVLRPADSQYYCKYGKYSILDKLKYKVKHKDSSIYIGEKCILFWNYGGAAAIAADTVIYECSGNYIIVNKNVEYFGEVVISPPQKNTKFAMDNGATTIY